jgi:hypothetical protein
MPVSADTEAWQRTAVLLRGADKKVAAAMRKSLREVAKPIGDEVATKGAEPMPHRGGLSAYLAANVKPTVSLTGKDISIRLQDKRGVKVKALDAGRLRHPLFGLRRHWYLQDIPAQAWTKAFTEQKDKALEAVNGAVRQTLNNLEG